jgi:hypothetical protein
MPPFNNLHSHSMLSSTEIMRNIADLVEQDDSRSHGILELLSAIQCNTSFPGIIPESILFSGSAAVTNSKALFCPGGSKILILDISASADGVSEISFNDQNSNPVFPSFFINNANGDTLSFSSFKGFFLQKSKSLYYTVSASVNWCLSISFKIIPID